MKTEKNENIDIPKESYKKITPKSAKEEVDYEGHTWKSHKPGFEINEKGQLRTEHKF